jgi:hypothetical protein
MISGPHTPLHSTILDLFPSGEREPAWVALVRSGRIHISFDGKTHLQVFLRGDDPKQASADNYSVIRHCLGLVFDMVTEPLHVDVFAYRNDYKASELRLNREPHSFSQESFEPDEGKISRERYVKHRFFSGAGDGRLVGVVGFC